MIEHLKFSYIGLIFLILLFIPNIIYLIKKPYKYVFESENENKILKILERLGQFLTTVCLLIFDNSNTNHTYYLISAFLLMLMYEYCWIRYFYSERKLSDFYRRFLIFYIGLFILPIMSFLMLAIYGKNIYLLISAVILGIGHIGIHIQHIKNIGVKYKEKNMNKNFEKEFSKVKHLLVPNFDLDKPFRDKKFNDTELDILDIGEINLTTGKIIACDPLAYLYEDDISPFIQTVKPDKYKVTLLIIKDEERISMIKVSFSDNKPERYELAVSGEENLSEAEEGDFFGYPVDAGMGCVCDYEAAKKYLEYEKKLEEESGGNFDNRYDDLFADLLEDNAKKNPKYQSQYGDWLNWNIPESDLNIVLFSSGYGDGYYPSYFAYDKNDDICAFYTIFIDLQE